MTKYEAFEAIASVSKQVEAKYPWLSEHKHAEGEYCLVLENVRWLEQPIPRRGMLGLWEFEGGNSRTGVVGCRLTSFDVQDRLDSGRNFMQFFMHATGESGDRMKTFSNQEQVEMVVAMEAIMDLFSLDSVVVVTDRNGLLECFSARTKYPAQKQVDFVIEAISTATRNRGLPVLNADEEKLRRN